MGTPDRHTAYVNDGVLDLEVTADELERLEHGHRSLDTGEGLPWQLLDRSAVANRANHGAKLAFGHVGLCTN